LRDRRKQSTGNRKNNNTSPEQQPTTINKARINLPSPPRATSSPPMADTDTGAAGWNRTSPTTTTALPPRIPTILSQSDAVIFSQQAQLRDEMVQQTQVMRTMMGTFTIHIQTIREESSRVQQLLDASQNLFQEIQHETQQMVQRASIHRTLTEHTQNIRGEVEMLQQECEHLSFCVEQAKTQLLQNSKDSHSNNKPSASPPSRMSTTPISTSSPTQPQLQSVSRGGDTTINPRPPTVSDQLRLAGAIPRLDTPITEQSATTWLKQLKHHSNICYALGCDPPPPMLSMTAEAFEQITGVDEHGFGKKMTIEEVEKLLVQYISRNAQNRDLVLAKLQTITFPLNNENNHLQAFLDYRTRTNIPTTQAIAFQTPLPILFTILLDKFRPQSVATSVRNGLDIINNNITLDDFWQRTIQALREYERRRIEYTLDTSYDSLQQQHYTAWSPTSSIPPPTTITPHRICTYCDRPHHSQDRCYLFLLGLPPDAHLTHEQIDMARERINSSII